MPKDLLTIVVSCTSPELAVPFNLTVATPANAATASTQLTTQPVLQPYLVDNEGKINFPVDWCPLQLPHPANKVLSYRTGRKQTEIPLSDRKTNFHTSFVHSNACAMIYSY